MTVNKELYKQAYQYIQKANNVLIVGHIHPDSDAISSASSLIELMINLDKPFKAFCQDKPKKVFDFLPHESLIAPDKSFNLADFDLLIVVDCGSIFRTALVEEISGHRNNLKIIEFDHHPKVSDYADIEIRDMEAASTTEVLYYFFVDNGININKDIATSLLAGILTDTANFLYSSTHEDTVAIASKLLAKGAQLPKIIDRTWYNKSIETVKLWGRALNNLQVNKKYNLAISVLTYSDLREYLSKEQLYDSDIFGEIAGFLSNLAKVQAVLLLREQEEGKIKGSLRGSAFGKVNLSILAQILGGGGHEKAAGFAIEGKLELTNNDSWKIV